MVVPSYGGAILWLCHRMAVLFYGCVIVCLCYRMVVLFMVTLSHGRATYGLLSLGRAIYGAAVAWPCYFTAALCYGGAILWLC
jgi:hypothetical protein